MIPELRNLSYERRLQRLELISLEQRRLRGQLIETFKYLNGLNNITLEGLFEKDGNELEPSKKAPNRLLASVVTPSPPAWTPATALQLRGVEETVEHLVLEFSKYEHEQDGCVVHEQCGENKWNARCVEEDSGMRYLVGLDEECNMTVVDAMKDFLVHAWNKRQ
ncbi:hypothetical protein FHG87_010328 [Trinorchestia longiramus]|nr:hypothetical protein FHG87_010328 [Trinorchestia longiramus]